MRTKVLKRRIAEALKYLVILILIGSTGYGLYYLFVQSNVFKVENIDVVGARSFVNKKDVLNLVDDRIVGQNVFSVKTSELEKLLEGNFQGAKSVRVSKDYPDEIEIKIVERIPLALLKNDQQDDYFLVDDEGYILGVVDEETTNLPKINYDGRLEVGFTIDEKLVPVYLDLLASVDENKLQASTMSISDRYVRFFLNKTVEVFIGKNKNIKKSVNVIAELLKQLELEGKNVSKIDLRYDKVVVEY